MRNRRNRLPERPLCGPFCFLINPLRIRADVPHDAEPTQGDENVMRDVDLPPVHPLSFGTRISVMIVMPSFTERDECEKKAVSAVVGRFESSLAPHVRERVDDERSVVQQGRADAESPDKKLRGVRSKLRVECLKERT